MPKVSLASPEQVNQALAALTGVRQAAFCDTTEEALDLVSDKCQRLNDLAPFNLGSCCPIFERVPVVSALLFRRNDQFLRKILYDLEQATCLLIDSHLRGKDGLFIARRFAEHDSSQAMAFAGRLAKSNPRCPSAVLIGTDRDGGWIVGYQLRQLFD